MSFKTMYVGSLRLFLFKEASHTFYLIDETTFLEYLRNLVLKVANNFIFTETILLFVIAAKVINVSFSEKTREL